MELRIAKCCGACKHVNKPKIPEDHIAHYSVAKTERWCYKHGRPVTREAVCNDFEWENKKGAVPAFKRILAFNKKLEEIIRIKNWIVENNIEKLIYYEKPDRPYMIFKIIDDKICYKYSGFGSYNIVSCKAKNEYEKLVQAYKQYFTMKT